MSERDDDIDWTLTSWEGSRREQLRRWRRLSLRERLEAVEEMGEMAGAFAQARAQGKLGTPREALLHGADTLAPGILGVREPGVPYKGNGDRHVLTLVGCAPIPLAAYLKALGLLRAVAEQADPEARGCWSDEQFILISRLDEAALADFLLERWEPTPVLAPWNGGIGFYPKDNQSGIEPMSRAGAPRFRGIRETIAQASDILRSMGLTERPDGELKRQLLTRLRAELPDTALAWLDGAVLLAEESPRYPPLLGTGGNDGRLDFTNNFLQRLVELFDVDTGAPTPKARQLLVESLHARATPGMPSSSIGQFSPGSAGGPNADTGFTGGATVNPWGFVLMLEGALLFAAAATRRLESTGAGALSYPFTVRPTGSGSGASALADEKPARAEMWLPLWSAPVGLSELRGLLAEGRVSLGRRPARDGLDFMRAVAHLSVERGIDAFQRYAFMMRSGKAYLATPLNRVRVCRNPGADLIDQLGHHDWLNRFRRLGRSDHASHRLASLVRRLEDALFDLARDGEYPGTHAERALICLGEAQLHLARSPDAREHCDPVPLLRENWVTTVLAGDGGAELRRAIALAGLHAWRLNASGDPKYVMPMADHLAPTVQDGRRRWWTDRHDHRVVWNHGDLHGNLLSVLQRRLLEAERLDLPDKPLSHAAPAPLSGVAAWLAGALDTRRIAALLPGLALARIPYGLPGDDATDWPVPAAFAVLKPFFCTDAQLRRAGLLPEHGRLPIPAELIRRLAGNQIEPALKLALRRLRIAGLAADFRQIQSGTLDGRRLLAALLAPLGDGDLNRLVRRLRRPVETNTTENQE